MFIELEDLIPNALIEIVENTELRHITSTQLLAYIQSIIIAAKKRKIKITLNLTKEKTTQFFHKYSNFFEILKINGVLSITLNNNISVECLKKEFRKYMSSALLDILINEKTIECLGINMAKI